MPDTLLKLVAADEEDIVVLPMFLEDAVVPVSKMIYLSLEKRFALVGHRFCWEDTGAEKIDGAIYERIRCVISFDNVIGVQRKRPDQLKLGAMLDLLALSGTK
ncbi:MAG: hypothetical protein CFH41_02860 [Alphaproteobacteria bacterium MarineAlpha11_Bin1]|nr:MAG: hypothetical protein CFH41_02860 [Alphaproteobacteria bacterium MarineAlpha11_Bin1]|tara:strand:+ start:3157 stop:3465 length:309 start_codon:yes stop_codon:yes gene_type:complete